MDFWINLLLPGNTVKHVAAVGNLPMADSVVEAATPRVKNAADMFFSSSRAGNCLRNAERFCLSSVNVPVENTRSSEDFVLCGQKNEIKPTYWTQEYMPRNKMLYVFDWIEQFSENID